MRIFLGGTCNKSTWRDILISMLRVDYFNPVVDDWNEDAQRRELEERENCDICLYVITPKMTGVYSIAEVVDDSNKRSEKTVLALLREDLINRFTDAQWKSLHAVAEMVKQNGTPVFWNLEDAAGYINSVTEVS